MGASCDCCERTDVEVVTFSDEDGSTVCRSCCEAMLSPQSSAPGGRTSPPAPMAQDSTRLVTAQSGGRDDRRDWLEGELADARERVRWLEGELADALLGEPCECGRPTSVCQFSCDFCTGGVA